MNEKELKILLELIDREINNLNSVKDRVNKKTHWEEQIVFLDELKEKLKTKIEYGDTNS
jgi:hypothetical protein